MPNVGCNPDIYSCLAVKENMVAILMGSSHLTQADGQLTPLLRTFTRVGKQSLQIRHTRFLTLGGTFQSPDATPVHRFSQMLIINNIFNTNAINTFN